MEGGVTAMTVNLQDKQTAMTVSMRDDMKAVSFFQRAIDTNLNIFGRDDAIHIFE
jgi:hypothetical protein